MCLYSSLVDIVDMFNEIFSMTTMTTMNTTKQKQQKDIKLITIDNNPLLHLVEKTIKQSKQREYIDYYHH